MSQGPKLFEKIMNKTEIPEGLVGKKLAMGGGIDGFWNNTVRCVISVAIS